MTGPQLKTLRISLGWSQREVADKLGEVTHSTLSRWESSEDDVPAWVPEKLFAHTTIHLPMPELHALLDLARERHLDFEDILSEALRDYIRARKPDPAMIQGATLAEEPPPYGKGTS